MEKDDAVAKQLRAHGDYVYDLQAVDRLAILRQTLEVVQKMLDVERRITDVASAKQLSPEVVRLMSEQARLVEQQPHVKITATEEEAAKCEAITTRINALIETHDGEVRRITAMPEGGNIFRREIDTEVTRDPSGFLAAQLRAVKGPSSTSAGTRADASPPNPESEARGEKFVSLVECSIELSEDLIAVSHHIKDASSAKKHAVTWAKLTADSMDLVEEQNKLAGLQLTGVLAERYQAAQRRDARQAQDCAGRHRATATANRGHANS